MPIYRHEGGGVWARLKSLYRHEGAGVWASLKNIYRYEGAGVWASIFSSILTPVETTAPTLRNATNVNPTPTNPDTMFLGGDTIYLTRGAYTETDTTTDTKYTMTIYKSINIATSLGGWTAVSGPTIYYGNNSNANTNITYNVTDLDARDGYYFAGRVAVNNDANTASSQDTDFDIKNTNGLAKISYEILNFFWTSVTANGATFSWNFTGLPGTDTLSYIYNQKLEVKRVSDNVTVYTLDNIPAATSIVTVNDSQIASNTDHYGLLTVIANDGWKTSNYPTSRASQSTNFKTLNPIPVNTSAVTITPLNNRSYAPANTQLTCNLGTWTNSPTSYTYSWQYDNGNTQLPPEDRWVQIPGSSTTTGQYLPPSTYVSSYGSRIRCYVTATNSSGSGFAIAGPHFVDSEVTISSVTPTSVNANVSTNFSFNVSNYPTSYVIDWTNDGTSDYSSTAIPISSSFQVQSASGNGTQITYSCSGNNFVAGSKVSITGMTPTSFNISNATVVSANSSSFVINSSVSGSTTVGGQANSNTSIIYATVPNTYSTGGTYTLKVTAQPGNKQSSTSINVTTAPTGSNFTRVDATSQPTQPGVITFSTSNNQVTSMWTNGSVAPSPGSTSVQFVGSGVASKNVTDSSAPFITSDTTAYGSSGTYTATVTNRHSEVVRFTWNQSNAASWRIDYSSSVYGADVAVGNSSASSVTYDLNFFGGGTFTWTGLTLYSAINQGTGASTYYPNPVAGGLVMSPKSSSRTNSTTVTYVTAPPPTTTTTTTAVRPNCPGTVTNPTSLTCAELGLPLLGGSTQYNIPAGYQCCGSATTTAAPVTTTAAPVTTTTTTTAGSNPGFTCTSFDVSIAACTSTGCDNSGCASGGACTGAIYRAGFGC